MASFLSLAVIVVLVSASCVVCATRVLTDIGMQRRLMQTANCLRGCSYKVQGSEVFSYLSASLDVAMDTLQGLNSEDITAPAFYPANKGKEITIPCPGSTYDHMFPVSVAGCFLTRTINANDTSLRQLIRNHVEDGNLQLYDVWLPTFQADPKRDLTRPGVMVPGQEFYISQCAHASTINPDRIPHARLTGCFFNPTAAVPPSLLASPLTLSKLATLLSTDVSTLQQLNPALRLTAGSIVVRQAVSATDGRPSPALASDNGKLAIPCSYYKP